MVLITKREIVGWEKKVFKYWASDTPPFTSQRDPKGAVKETEALAGNDVIGG